MMLTNGTKECPLTDEIVSYMYDELAGNERDGFEIHLAQCSVCTDDFAAISNPRFAVFEWRKKEFDQLATPTIVIPELRKPAVAVGAESGWFAALAGMLSFPRAPLAAAAVLLAALGAGFIALAYLSDTDALIVANTDVSVPVVESNETGDKRSVIDTPAPRRTVDPAKGSAQSKRPASSDALPAATKVGVQKKVKQDESPRIAKKPVLNDFQDETDDSLRLAKLLDEIGG